MTHVMKPEIFLPRNRSLVLEFHRGDCYVTGSDARQKERKRQKGDRGERERERGKEKSERKEEERGRWGETRRVRDVMLERVLVTGCP